MDRLPIPAGSFHTDGQATWSTRMATRCSPGYYSDGRDFDHGGFRWDGQRHFGGADGGAAGGLAAARVVQQSGGLNSTGSNLFLQTTASGDPVVGTPGGSEGLGSIVQGMLEQSNVSVVTEFVNMIVAQRSYEASSRVVNAADQCCRPLIISADNGP